MIANKSKFMYMALQQAKKAFECNEVPVGAVIVRGQEVISKAYNQVEIKNTQLAHAEILAIQKAGKKLGDWRLEQCALFVTLEPCCMCMAAIKMSRVRHVVFGASSNIYGFSVDKSLVFDESKASLIIEGGILENESRDLLKLFFKNKREEKSVRKKYKL